MMPPSDVATLGERTQVLGLGVATRLTARSKHSWTSYRHLEHESLTSSEWSSR
jgi:hypothetical protein